MGQSLLVSIAAAAIITAGVMSQITSTTLEAQNNAQADASKVLAREMAFTGLSVAKQQVFTAFDEHNEYTGPASLAGTYHQGDFNVDIATSDTQLVLQAAGNYSGVKHRVTQTFNLVPEEGLPPFMSHSITCGRNLNINSGLTLGSIEPDLNASVFANGKLHLGKSSAVEGFGYYADNSGGGTKAYESMFNPKDNPDGDPVLQVSEALDIPIFDPTEYADIATQVTMGQVKLSGNYALGTKEAPVIWYIDGNVSTNGPVQFTGYGAVVVNGKVNISDDFVGEYNAGESALALYADKGITVSAKVSNVTGQWFSNSNVTISGNVHFAGSMAIGDSNCNFAKAFSMTYVPASEALTKDFWSAENDLTMLSSHEW